MNATANNIADDDIVKLSCSLKYRTSNQQNVHVMIAHPGAEEIDTDTKEDYNEISSAVTVKVESTKNTERATLFGPVQCTVDFRQRENAVDVAVFSTKPVQLGSDDIPASRILSKCRNRLLFICLLFKHLSDCVLLVFQYCTSWLGVMSYGSKNLLHVHVC